MKPLLVVLSFVALCAGSCKKKDALADFDKNELFAPATAEEINTVEQIWTQRNLIPDQVRIENTHAINSNLSLHIISFILSGNKEYAAVLIPDADQPLPVAFNIGGFSLEGEPVNSVHIQLADDTLPFIYVVPALRGQYASVQINDITYNSPISEGSRLDAFDGATDDVIATLNAIDNLYPAADTSRAMIRGASRGGTVALLAGERDPRFKRVASVAFNVDFIGLTSQFYNDPTYKSQFLTSLINGTATVAQTRQLMIASSPLYFCSHLPQTQMHCGENDKITPASQAQLLFDKMKQLGLEDRVELFIYPGRTHDNIGTNNIEMQNRINNFFSGL